MKVIQLTLGAMASNCYLIKRNNQVLIVDPGDLPDTIIQNINKDENVLAVLLTHGHFDHIGALDSVVKEYNCPVYLSKSEKELISNSNLSFYDGEIESQLTFIENDFRIGGFNIKVHHTPGHTAGSVMYQIDEHLFTGDTIFDGAIGRVDFPTGSINQMQKSLEYIKTLNPDLIIYPGHNEVSTLKKQLKYNPYLNR